ncbi:MAG: hypothetical protein ACLUPK_00015 [Veillonella sp.]
MLLEFNELVSKSFGGVAALSGTSLMSAKQGEVNSVLFTDANMVLVRLTSFDAD